MERELAEKKIEALLHDPPGKAPTLWYRSHERFSDELVTAVLGRPPRYGEVVKTADRLASAVDRLVRALGARGARARRGRGPPAPRGAAEPVKGTVRACRAFVEGELDTLLKSGLHALRRC